jgi:hypothetical protein
MKKSLNGWTLAAILAIAGCNQGTPGGPGATKDNTKLNQADSTFNLSVPVLASSVKQGNQIEATVGINRAKNFAEDVSLKFADVPKGVTVEPANPSIHHGDTSAKIKFTAIDDAPLGDFKIKVIGHPDKGSDAQVEFKLEVSAKDSFTLSFPTFRSSVKQGASKIVTVGINRDKDFDQDVSLMFGKLPDGVSIEPAMPIIKNGESETEFTITTVDDASLGNFEIKVTGHPTKGVDYPHGFSFTVAKN